MTDSTSRQPTVGQRIRAAKELGGFASLDDLAEAAAFPNLGARSLRRTALDERQASRWELQAIAEACGLDPSFFYVDFHLYMHTEEFSIRETPAREEDGATPADLQEQIKSLSDAVAVIRARLEDMNDDAERAVRDVSRAVTQSLVDRLEADAPATEAGAGTRDAEDATSAPAQARREGRR